MEDINKRQVVGKKIPIEAELLQKASWLRGYEFVQRRRILRETIEAFTKVDPRNKFQLLATQNLHRWRFASDPEVSRCLIKVIPGDWGEVTRSLTKAYGACFAVLNMANAYVPGGGYVEGLVAQEENMFRRTDCHFYINPDEFDPITGRYTPSMTKLITAQNGRVYFDEKQPRICIRGPEDREHSTLGYSWLADDEIFPFFELRAAAQDLRDGSKFDADDARKRIAAQLDTLRGAQIRHAVLSAFGCGAFRNPADQIAQIYKEELALRKNDFSVVAFAIFHPGYGPDNYTPFANIFAQF